MYGGKVELCGVDTSRLPVLSEAEKSTLLRAARAGDRVICGWCSASYKSLPTGARISTTCSRWGASV